MKITLNIGLEVSKNYLPFGVVEMHLQYEHIQVISEQVFGKPVCIGMTQSATEKTVVVEYTNVELVLQKLFWLAREFKQDCIAYKIQDDDGAVLGGALVGEYAHEWNYGVFNEEYFVETILHTEPQSALALVPLD